MPLRAQLYRSADGGLSARRRVGECSASEISRSENKHGRSVPRRSDAVGCTCAQKCREIGAITPTRAVRPSEPVVVRRAPPGGSSRLERRAGAGRARAPRRARRAGLRPRRPQRRFLLRHAAARADRHALDEADVDGVLGSEREERVDFADEPRSWRRRSPSLAKARRRARRAIRRALRRGCRRA